jgi:oxygen-independent coproporphyrinogen-3 oxidase
MSAPFSLYVHVPWCRHVCPYCDFNVHAAAVPPEREYVAAVSAEVQAWAARPPWRGRPLGTVFFGGGTPSLLSPAALERLLGAAAGAFGLAAGAEVTLEANPGTVSGETLRGYVAAGVNRLSLGAQSFHARHLRTLGRNHCPDDISRAVEAARRASLANVSLDLIFAVPGETVADWERDLAAAIALAPEHVSAYALTYEEGTPFHAWRATGRITPVADDEEAAMADAAATMLAAAGYERYEISSFARPGFASRHNLAYWDGSDYLGVGPGAHSFGSEPFPGRRWMNERLPQRYLAAVGGCGLAVASEEHLTEAQARAEFCFTGLRRLVGVDAAAFARRFGRPLEEVYPQVARLVGDGLLERAGETIRLSPRGLAFADTVAASFL